VTSALDMLIPCLNLDPMARPSIATLRAKLRGRAGVLRHGSFESEDALYKDLGEVADPIPVSSPTVQSHQGSTSRSDRKRVKSAARHRRKRHNGGGAHAALHDSPQDGTSGRQPQRSSQLADGPSLQSAGAPTAGEGTTERAGGRPAPRSRRRSRREASSGGLHGLSVAAPHGAVSQPQVSPTRGATARAGVTHVGTLQVVAEAWLLR